MFIKLLILCIALAPFCTSKLPLTGNATTMKNKLKVFDSGSERIVIDHGLELYRSLQNHESDCFRAATVALHDGCNSLSYDSVENMEYALMLTFCELGSAKWKLPKVCFEISEDFSKATRNKVKQCVKRLSDTPQTWTSYSGYFRDVFLMCFAIRYPMEKEILDQVHRNITANQARNFDILQEQQEFLIKWRNEEFKTLGKMNTTQQTLLDQMEKIRGAHAKSADQIQLIFDALVLLQNQTEAVIFTYNNMVKYHVGEVQNQLNQLVNRQEFEVDYVMGTIVDGLQRINTNIGEMITIQQEALQSWSHSKDIQKEYLEAWTGSIIDVNRDLNNFLNESLTNVKTLHDNISSVHQQIKVFTSPFEQILNTLSNFYISVQHILLNVTMYGSLLHILNATFRHQPLFVRAFIMTLLPSMLHFTLKYLFGRLPAYNVPIKVGIILLEWLVEGLMSDIVKKTKVKLHSSIHRNVEINDKSEGKSNVTTDSNKKKAQITNVKTYNQLQQVPHLRNRLTERLTKDESGEIDVKESESTIKRYNKLKLKDEQERFPIYQFHKYYHVE